MPKPLLLFFMWFSLYVSFFWVVGEVVVEQAEVVVLCLLLKFLLAELVVEAVAEVIAL